MQYTAPKILHTQKADVAIRGLGKRNPLNPDSPIDPMPPSTVAGYSADE